MATRTDYQIASLAAGFTIGFGFLTVWEAIKQTKRNRNPLRSTYIYMIWGEIIANLVIAVIGWLFLDGVLGPTVPVLFFILFLWVWEIQLLMQIIINRISVIAESQETILYMKWGTALGITLINIAVFCIWIPSHLDPPVSQTFVAINHYWDRLSKILILLVDAGLNWYFLRVVKTRLLNQHGLVKYKPLVGFNAKLMILSIAMDALLIGLMSLPNQVVYIQFHPVAYMVKLNIEMSMASLITRLAKDHDSGLRFDSLSYSHGNSGGQRSNPAHPEDHSQVHHETGGIKSFHQASVGAVPTDRGLEALHPGASGIHRRVDVEVQVESPKSNHTSSFSGRQDDAASSNSFYRVDDEDSLTSNAGHPGPPEKKD
ncbi:hypothetical protein ColTof4_07442 [Colletotrichum tofieldiae]|nr:hypothetical protein ColTof3_12391 [Colletotrichum tofieldiae]GKT75019.1 hypothetical protein ColTof4_07442 [Colletotrichum tofieldiae]